MRTVSSPPPHAVFWALLAHDDGETVIGLDEKPNTAQWSEAGSGPPQRAGNSCCAPNLLPHGFLRSTSL